MAASGQAKPGLWGWINKRLPADEFIRTQLHDYFAPKNFNIWYFFGSLALMVLVIQILSGIFLTMFYKVGDTTAFDSVEYIMREVNYGWLIRLIHSTGASAFFVVVYLHMYRALLYGSYKAPRELLWLFGMFIYLALMGEAFMGYVLPWGNMSYWGAQVIINLFGTIPVVGDGLVEWIRGDYSIADSTLSRFFALHVAAVPLAIILLVTLHLVALRHVGSNNPDGIEIKENLGPDGKPVDGIPFHPYYTVKDLVGVGLFLVLFCVVLFFAPTFNGIFLEQANFEPANPISTPEDITPSWYFTPYYAILRSIPDQKMGALAMLLSIVVWFFLPWLDRSPVRSVRYRSGIFKFCLTVFTISFCGLMYLGLQKAEQPFTTLARICMAGYFLFFVTLPFYTWGGREKHQPLPKRVNYHHD
jgi:ubiquinol-cytochrome c reductase cytochrome b subunit